MGGESSKDEGDEIKSRLRYFLLYLSNCFATKIRLAMKLFDFHFFFFPDSSGEDHLSDNFVVCTSSADCYPISPSILISILGGLGENLPTSASENDVNIDIPQRRGISGSYLFRSKKADGEKEKKSNRRGGYLFRTKKMGRYTRGKLLPFL